jgi:hypothetical protein
MADLLPIRLAALSGTVTYHGAIASRKIDVRRGIIYFWKTRGVFRGQRR